MKKLLTIIIAILTISMLYSCHEEGTIINQGNKSIIINNKPYKFIRIVPCKSCDGVWLLIPEDATLEIPQSTSVRVSCGKNCSKQLECIWIKS